MSPSRWWIVAVALIALVSGDALAKGHHKSSKAKPKYHFEVEQVKAGEGVEGQVAADVIKMLGDEATKQFGSHAQMVGDVSAAPDPKTDAKGYSAWLAKNKIKGSFAVVVDVTSYSEETEDSPKGDGSKRF